MRPDDLFAAAGLRRVTGFRYVSFFQKKDFLKFSGNNWEGRYYITYKGKMFLEGEDVDLKDVNSRYYKGKLEREMQKERTKEVRDRLEAVMQQKKSK